MHQPVREALGVIARHAHAGNTTYYPLGEAVPTHRGVSGDWEDIVYRLDTRGRGASSGWLTRWPASRLSGCAALQGDLGGRRRPVAQPDADLPRDFEQRRVEHYRELRKPLDPGEFIAGLRGELDGELSTLNEALSELSWLSITDRRSGAITLTPIEAQIEPCNLRRLKAEVLRRWGTVPLVDMLKEAVLCAPAAWTRSARSPGGAAYPPKCWPTGCCW